MKNVQKQTKLSLFALLATVLLCSPLSFSGMQKVYAQQAVQVVGGPIAIANGLQNALSAVSNAAIAAGQASELFKELTLDPIAWNMSQQLIGKITKQALDYINKGFDGQPAFVQNLADELTAVANEVAAGYIYGSEHNNLCEAAEFSVRSNLITQELTSQGRSNPASASNQCRADQISGGDNQAFLEGDFTKGSWDAWFHLTQNPDGDVYRSYLNASVGKEVVKLDAQFNELELLRYGSGYKSKKQCEPVTGADGQTTTKCYVVVPGAIAERTATYNTVEVPTISLLQADEFNEIISSLSSNLLNQVLNGFGGLLGLSEGTKYSNNGYGDGSQSYLDALVSDSSKALENIIENPIKDSLEAEREYQDLQIGILEDITELEAQLAEGESKASSCFNLELSDELVEEGNNAVQNIAVSTTTEGVLVILDEAFTNSPGPAEQSAVLNQYLSIEKQGILRTSYKNKELAALFIELEFAEMVFDFQVLIDNEFSSCNITNSIKPENIDPETAANRAIKSAEDKIDDLESAIDDASTSNPGLEVAEEALTEATSLLDDANDFLDEEEFEDAENKANSSLREAQFGIDSLGTTTTAVLPSSWLKELLKMLT